MHPAATASLKGPHPLTTSTIGGTQEAFDVAFRRRYYLDAAAWYKTTLSDGLPVMVCVCTIEPGTDGLPHLAFMQIVPEVPVHGWLTSQQIQSILGRFLPNDAVYVRDFTDAVVGRVRVYRSVRLAATFPDFAFLAFNGESTSPAPPGTISAACNNPGVANNPFAGCDIAIGLYGA